MLEQCRSVAPWGPLQAGYTLSSWLKSKAEDAPASEPASEPAPEVTEPKPVAKVAKPWLKPKVEEAPAPEPTSEVTEPKPAAKVAKPWLKSKPAPDSESSTPNPEQA